MNSSLGMVVELNKKVFFPLHETEWWELTSRTKKGGGESWSRIYRTWPPTDMTIKENGFSDREHLQKEGTVFRVKQDALKLLTQPREKGAIQKSAAVKVAPAP